MGEIMTDYYPSDVVLVICFILIGEFIFDLVTIQEDRKRIRLDVYLALVGPVMIGVTVEIIRLL